MSEPTNPEVAILNAALELPAGQRAAFLEESCAGNAALRQKVEALLEAHEHVGDFLEEPPAGFDFKRTEMVEPPLTEKPGDRIGRYKLLQQIGEGGCGVVYMAEQEEPVRRRVALKVIKLGMDTKTVIARFEAERQALALMDHPNIAKVLDAGATETGRPYFVMELVRGIKITEFCDENKISTEERLKLFIQVCQAIQHAHQKGIIHRDIKPSNILVTINDGVPVPKVIDFGIAKATQERLTDKTLFTAFEQFIGTPAYMSPEQAVMTSLDIDTRSDIYSLGVLLYELLTGKTPFDAQELLQSGLDAMRRTILETEPPKPSTRLSTMLDAERTVTANHRHTDPPKLIHLVRGDLDWIVMKSLEKDRARRYETANGLAADIQRHLKNEPVNACPPSGVYRLQKAVRRNKGPFAAAAVIVVVLLVGVIASTSQAIRARRAEQEQIRLRKQAELDEEKAKTEAVKSEQVAKFLKDMLKAVGPSVALGRDTKMLREILDRTAVRIGTDLKDQPLVASELRDTIGQVYEDLGDYPKAEAMIRETLTARRKLLGNDHPDVADSLAHLGEVLLDEGKPAEAELMEREALAIWRKAFGVENLAVAHALRNLGFALRRGNKLTESEERFREALVMSKKLFGDESEEVAITLGDLGWLIYRQGRTDEAEAMMREGLAIDRKLYPNGHPSLAARIQNLAVVLDEGQGKFAEAEGMLREALIIERSILGSEHPNTVISLENFGVVLQKQNKLTEAEPIFREALAIQKKLKGNENLDVANSLGRLAGLLQDEGRLTEAESLARESLVIHEKLELEPDQWRTFDCRSLLGGILLDQKRYAEAEPMVVSAYEGLKLRADAIPLRARNEPVRRALCRGVQLFEATSRPDLAAEWKLKLAQLNEAESKPKVSPSKP